jgi:peptidoglycan/LPS O-acetylase OafA/YrhL
MNDAVHGLIGRPPGADAAALAKSHNGIQLNAIESLRGVAALMVLLYHLVELLKVPLPAPLSMIRTHFGLGVPLFYSLSGFVLAFGYAEHLNSSDKMMGYFIRRWFRIAPLFFVMLVVWIAINWILWRNTFSSQTLFLNVSFLFGLVPGSHESIVWAGWSVGIEMLFYLVFPVLIVFIRNTWTGVGAFVGSCILSAAVYNTLVAAGLPSFAYMNLPTHLPYFLAGIVSYRIWQEKGFSQAPAAGAVLLGAGLLLAAALAGSDRVYQHLVDLRFGAAERNAWALVFGMLILSVCFSKNRLLESGPLRYLGQLSFSVYLTHPLVMLMLIQLGFVKALEFHLPGSAAVFVVGALTTFALVVVTSAVSFRFIEAPGIALGRTLATRSRRPVRSLRP